MTNLTIARCPECGAPLVVDETAETESPVFRAKTGRVESVARPAIVATCSGCEFAIELKPLPVGGYNVSR